MNKLLILSLTVVLVAGLAGCATPETKTTTPTTSNITTTTPATTTPAVNDTEDDEHEMAPIRCPDPPSTNATPGSKLGYPEIVFTVKEGNEADPCFSFLGPASVSAGWTAVTLQDNGFQPHIMPMFKIDRSEPITRDEIYDLLANMTEDEEEPEWLVPAGGVGVATPFSSGTAIMDLTPGQYVVICFFGGHHMQGMYRVLNVTAATGTPLSAPTANFTIDMHDFNFTVPNVTAGTHIVAFANKGTQPHEAPMIRLVGNATMEQFLDAVENGGPDSPPPPGAGIGGVNELASGATAYAIVDFTPGNYGLVCFVESDEHDHTPHFLLGMIKQFTVA